MAHAPTRHDRLSSTTQGTIRSRLTIASVVSLLLATGCGARVKAYPGEPLPIDAIGVVVPGYEHGFGEISRYLVIAEVDGQPRVEEWTGGSGLVHLLPGEHRFRVKYHQISPLTGILLLDLTIMAGDARENASHKEATLTIPIVAGATHRVYYDYDERTFAVSRRPTMVPIDLPPMKPLPSKDIVECVDAVEHSDALWCERHPEESISWPRPRSSRRASSTVAR